MKSASIASSNFSDASPMLKAENVTKLFGGLMALDSLDLQVEADEVVGIIGPNGSGKTTLLNIITGVYGPTSGTITFHGENITGLKSHQIARRGIARTFQNLRLFPLMTVFQNIWAAQHARTPGGALGLLATQPSRDAEARRSVDQALSILGLQKHRDDLAKNLPLPAQRRVEIARILAAKPKFILLDEPAGGMVPAETAEMARLIRKVVAPGHGCIVVEHKMDLIARVCDRLCVLDFGRKIAEGKPANVLGNKAVQEAYLGRDPEQHA